MNWTLSRRIIAGFGVALILIIFVALIGIAALSRALAAYDDALVQERDIVVPALRVATQSRDASLQFHRYVLSPQPEFLAARDSAMAASRDLLAEIQTRVEADRLETWTDAAALFERWDSVSLNALAAVQAGDEDGATRIWENEALPLRLDLERSVQEGIDNATERASTVVRDASEAALGSQRLLLYTALLAVVLDILAALLLNRAITNPLRETTGVLASSAAEILAATTQQSSSATETSSAVVETSATIDEIAQTSEQAAGRARGLATSAQRAAEIGKSGRKSVDESVRAMDELKTQVESIAGSILVLADQATAIGEIIATVNDIADQTNLLALNAAVEAARAGEQGRGFAVVAGEIRNLAEESKRATVQVRQILGEIQRATSTAVLTTERGTQDAAAGARQIQKTGETIRELAAAIEDAAQAAAQIVASAGQQAAGMSQIREAMAEIETASKQNLASTRQAEQAARDLNDLGARLLALVSTGNGTRR